MPYTPVCFFGELIIDLRCLILFKRTRPHGCSKLCLCQSGSGIKEVHRHREPSHCPIRVCPLARWHLPLHRCPLGLTPLLLVTLGLALCFSVTLACLSLARRSGCVYSLTAWCSVGLSEVSLLFFVDEASQSVWSRFIHSFEDLGHQRSFQCGCHLHLLGGHCPHSRT